MENIESKSAGELLREKWQAKLDKLDARMEELKAMEFNDEVEEEMYDVMYETNTILRAMHRPEDEMYDI